MAKALVYNGNSQIPDVTGKRLCVGVGPDPALAWIITIGSGDGLQQERIVSHIGGHGPCFFMHGNRDFLVAESYAKDAGFAILPESVVLDLYGTPTLLLHGDTLCTDDVEYQAFRGQVRDPAWQVAFLSRTPDERLSIAQQARDASKQHTATASMEIMDVNQEAVLQSFTKHNVRHMIHGHTHRPAFHQHELEDGSMASRIVLADWYEQGYVLHVSHEGTSTIEL